jgi:diguanylate cyclase (GGDEF)-like protein
MTIAAASSGVKEREVLSVGGGGTLPDRDCDFAEDFLPMPFHSIAAFDAVKCDFPPAEKAIAMNLVARQDRALLVGLAAALIVVFAQPIRYLLDLASEVERSSGLALVPALIILTVVFTVHQHGKRREAKSRAVLAEADAQEAAARASEMEHLVDFGQALGRSLDRESIRAVVMEHLPSLCGSSAAWVMMHVDDTWVPLTDSDRARRDRERVCQCAAERAVAAEGAWQPAPILVDGHLCLPMTAGGLAVGVLGLPGGERLSDGRTRVVTMAAALLAIALRNAQLFHEVRENSLRDGLTGCVNRTHAMAVIDMELRRARRSRLPVSLIMLDIDHFKKVNDRYGHLGGDAVLAAVGTKLREVLRGSDLKCRYGGEEFLVLLPETPLEGAKRVADTLCRDLANLPIHWQGQTISITASLGVAVAHPAEFDTPALIGRADAALYSAKHHGRNCVRLSIETGVREREPALNTTPA